MHAEAGGAAFREYAVSSVKLCAIATSIIAGLSITTAQAVMLIPVANASFESPVVDVTQTPASPFVDGWVTDGPTQVPNPYVPGETISIGTGIFPNTAPGSVDHLDNMDGPQAAFMAAETGNEFSQLLPATFEAGLSYALTVAIAHSYGYAPDAASKVSIGLYYLDDANQRQWVASTDVFNDAVAGLSATHFVDFSAISSPLAADAAALGKPIHVLLTTVGTPGGFFDLDNVRVTATPEPVSCLLLALGGALLPMIRRRTARR